MTNSSSPIQWKFFFRLRNNELRTQHFLPFFPFFPRDCCQRVWSCLFFLEANSIMALKAENTFASFIRTTIKFSFHSKYITRSFAFVFRQKNIIFLGTISLHFALLTIHDHSDIVYLSFNNLWRSLDLSLTAINYFLWLGFKAITNSNNKY